MRPVPLTHECHGQIIQVAATPLQRGDEEDEQRATRRKTWKQGDEGDWVAGCWLCSEALLQEAVSRWMQVRVVASAMPMLCFVPVVRVIAFSQLPLSLPLPLPLPPAVLVLFIFAVAVPPFPPLVLLASWEVEGYNTVTVSAHEEPLPVSTVL